MQVRCKEGDPTDTIELNRASLLTAKHVLVSEQLLGRAVLLPILIRVRVRLCELTPILILVPILSPEPDP